MNMTCEVQRQGGIVHFLIGGDLSIEEADLMKKKFIELPLGEIREVIFDLSGVSFLGSSAIGSFLIIFKRLKAQKGVMRLVRVPKMIADLLCELKLDTLFPIESL